MSIEEKNLIISVSDVKSNNYYKYDTVPTISLFYYFAGTTNPPTCMVNKAVCIRSPL